MRRFVGVCVNVVVLAFASPVLAQDPSPSSQPVCITITGEVPAGGWTPASLSAAIASGRATIATVGECVPSASPSPTPLPAGDTGAWVLSGITKDPITDEPTALAYVESTGSVSFGQEPTLLIRCKDGRTDLFISWNDYLGSSDESTETAVRLDNGPVTTSRWGNSTDSTAAFFSSGDVIEEIKSLFGHDEMVARVTPYNSSAVTATFPITGVENAVKDVRGSCGW